MKRTYLIAIVFIAGAALFLFLREIDQASERSAPAPQSVTTPANALETQTNSEGSVAVKVTPKVSTEVAFEITLDTHSEELSVDMTQAATLLDENGKEYVSVGWEGDPPGGHHREGVLSFGSIAPIPKTLQLIIRQIGGVAERNFLWTIRP